MSIVSALTASARSGVLIKGGVYLEAMGRLQALALDKTGTLTYGRPEVQRVLPLNEHTERELLELAAALDGNSEHPLRGPLCVRRARPAFSRQRPKDFRRSGGKARKPA
ncbi:HAD family hydrolase [bacterium]|nr:HAD family hydrolase [bacterium]